MRAKPSAKVLTIHWCQKTPGKHNLGLLCLCLSPTPPPQPPTPTNPPPPPPFPNVSSPLYGLLVLLHATCIPHIRNSKLIRYYYTLQVSHTHVPLSQRVYRSDALVSQCITDIFVSWSVPVARPCKQSGKPGGQREVISCSIASRFLYTLVPAGS